MATVATPPAAVRSTQSSPGSPAEQRRKEKTTLQNLNDRLETVLQHIRSENKALAKTLRDHEDLIHSTEEVIAVNIAEQTRLSAAMQDSLNQTSAATYKRVINVHANAEVEGELDVLLKVELWDRSSVNPEDTDAKYVEYATAIAKKRLEIAQANATKSFLARRDNLHGNAINDVKARGRVADTASKEQETTRERHERELQTVIEKNEAAERIVLSSENAEAEAAMQVHIQAALDEKEKTFQADLQKKLELKSQEFLAKSRREVGDPELSPPAKIDMVEQILFEKDVRNTEDERTNKESELKYLQPGLAIAKEKQKSVMELRELLIHETVSLRQQNVAVQDALNAEKAKADNVQIQTLGKQIEDKVKERKDQEARYAKSKQLLLRDLGDTENQYNNQVILDSVLAEYEQIVRAYEEKYKQRGPQESTDSLPPLPNVPLFGSNSNVPARKPARAQKGKGRAKSTPGRGKIVEDGSDVDANTNGTGSVVVAGSSSSSSGSGAVVDSRKRKEPSRQSVRESEDEGGNVETPADTPALKLIGFNATLQVVKLRNTSSRPVDLTGYRIRNCDYHVSQLLPRVVLGPEETFTIAPKPKGAAKPPRNHAFWEGENGHFDTNSKGIRLLGLQQETIDELR